MYSLSSATLNARAAHPAKLRKGYVIFERKNSPGVLFEARDLLAPVVSLQPEIRLPAIRPSALARDPEFLVPRKFFRRLGLNKTPLELLKHYQ